MSQKSERERVQEMHTGADGNYTEVERFQMVYDKDNIELTRLGKRPVLKVSKVSSFQAMFSGSAIVSVTSASCQCSDSIARSWRHGKSCCGMLITGVTFKSPRIHL